MTSISLILSFIVSGILEVTIPIILAYYVARKLKGRPLTFLVGGVLFLISLIRIPLNSVVIDWIASNFTGLAIPLLATAFPSLTAGLFEEGARWLGLRFLIKDHRVENGVMYGVGHGGFESIFLVGASVLSTGVVLWLMPQSIPTDQMTAINSMPLLTPFIGVYERIFTLSIQIGLSILVLRSITEHKPVYLVAAIASHFLIDFTTVYAIQFGVFAAEAVVTVFGVIALYYTMHELRTKSMTQMPSDVKPTSATG